MSDTIDLFISGRPVSFQTRGQALRDWKKRVGDAARARVPKPSASAEMAVAITHYYRIPPRFDADNMAKAICDALNNIVYADDRQIVERLARRVPINGRFSLWDMPRELALALCGGREFVHIRVTRYRVRTLASVFCSEFADQDWHTNHRWAGCAGLL